MRGFDPHTYSRPCHLPPSGPGSHRSILLARLAHDGIGDSRRHQSIATGLFFFYVTRRIHGEGGKVVQEGQTTGWVSIRSPLVAVPRLASFVLAVTPENSEP